MKTHKNMLIAFVLNFAFSIFELFGGLISGSFAIMSDALHDAGDALAIGISLLSERKSKKGPDRLYSFGYGRFSLVGALFTTSVLLCGSLFIIVNAVEKIQTPAKTDYGKMIVFAIIGVLVNSVSVFMTRGKTSANQRAVNLHMLEDVLGWICVLAGAVIMSLTDLYIIDPLMSICVSLFIIFHSVENMKSIFGIFLEKVPCDIDIADIREHLMNIEGISDVHHLHVWAFNEGTYLATMHIVTDSTASEIKGKVRKELLRYGIRHVTLEIEKNNETCPDRLCSISQKTNHEHCHSHQHRH